MKRIRNLFEKYYIRPLYNKSAFVFGVQGVSLLTFISFVVFLSTFNQYKEFHIYSGIISVLFLILAVMNAFGVKYYDGNTKSRWLVLPYVTAMLTIFVFYVTLIVISDKSIKSFVILYPIVYPIFSFLWQLFFFDKFLEDRQAKLKALVLGTPLLIAIFSMALLAFMVTFFESSTEFFLIALTTLLAFFNLEVPLGFTKTSEYWHPELKQSRYDEAMGALQQTKKPKKTGKKKKKKKLKK